MTTKSIHFQQDLRHAITSTILAALSQVPSKLPAELKELGVCHLEVVEAEPGKILLGLTTTSGKPFYFSIRVKLGG